MNTEKEKSTSVFVNHGESLALVTNASNFSKSVLPFGWDFFKATHLVIVHYSDFSSLTSAGF